MANEENLVPNSQRSPSELRAMTQKGGKASGKARAEKASLRKALEVLLEMEHTEEKTGIRLRGYEAVAAALFHKAANGDVTAFKELRDTVGEKPVSGVSLESGNETMKEIKIAFVDKSKPKTQKEQDPKIVGDYTPAVNSDKVQGHGVRN